MFYIEETSHLRSNLDATVGVLIKICNPRSLQFVAGTYVGCQSVDRIGITSVEAGDVSHQWDPSKIASWNLK